MWPNKRPLNKNVDCERVYNGVQQNFEANESARRLASKIQSRDRVRNDEISELDEMRGNEAKRRAKSAACKLCDANVATCNDYEGKRKCIKWNRDKLGDWRAQKPASPNVECEMAIIGEQIRVLVAEKRDCGRSQRAKYEIREQTTPKVRKRAARKLRKNGRGACSCKRAKIKHLRRVKNETMRLMIAEDDRAAVELDEDEKRGAEQRKRSMSPNAARRRLDRSSLVEIVGKRVEAKKCRPYDVCLTNEQRNAKNKRRKRRPTWRAERINDECKREKIGVEEERSVEQNRQRQRGRGAQNLVDRIAAAAAVGDSTSAITRERNKSQRHKQRIKISFALAEAAKRCENVNLKTSRMLLIELVREFSRPVALTVRLTSGGVVIIGL